MSIPSFKKPAHQWIQQKTWKKLAGISHPHILFIILFTHLVQIRNDQIRVRRTAQVMLLQFD